MLVLYFLDKYLTKIDDYKFTEYWEHKMIPRTRYFIFGLFLYFLLALYLIVTILTYGSNSLLLDILVFFISAFIYGFYFIRYAFSFFAKNNAKFVLIMSGMQEDTFDKSNVVN